MAVYRNIVGSIKDAQGSLVASGRIKVKPLTPVIDGTAFVSPERVTVDVTSGLFDLTLVAPCIYEFIVEDIYEESMWTFVATLTDDSAADITLSELYAYGRVAIDDTVSLITTLLGLFDTPNSFEGQAGKALVVNGDEDGIEFV